ncbi:MAG: hypothetical protein A2V70_14425 [Planctomycetes bacterium RBG_13_63_9]|nr:MAG: hypothetical protein A2V70_14425 [Planctomycetes bacterium RBG_13_63_9]
MSNLDLIIKSTVWRQSLPVTVWPALQAADRDSLDYFARRYGTAIYSYFRRHRIGREDAKDLTMGFLLEKLIAGRLLHSFQPGPHKFRSYLTTALRHYLIDWLAKEGRRRKAEVEAAENASSEVSTPIEEESGCQVICESTHDRLREVLLLVKCECDRDGLQEHFTMFCLRVFLEPRPTWEQIGHRFGVGWQKASNKARTVQERLRQAIFEEFRLQGMSDAQVVEELYDLIGTFRNFEGRELFSQEWIEWMKHNSSQID